MSEQKLSLARKLVGTVVSNKMKDTIVVRVERQVEHSVYGKYIKRTSKVHAHDAGNTCQAGDVVEVQECRPLSKLKRWKLVDVVERSGENQ
ncbi:MAG TPA: 30S ribosomal protein S17 [Coxiellaceae bacterium]|nr:30S ribosomal protein S17 [Coxiellaceae bacterium]